jgi:ferric-dicitrate binding protein FerR (iron transport regulator)
MVRRAFEIRERRMSEPADSAEGMVAEASAWLARLTADDCDLEAALAFDEWLQGLPRRRFAFRRVLSAWHEIGGHSLAILAALDLPPGAGGDGL